MYGFGAHIRSTQKKLTILNKGTLEEYPLEQVKNLLIVGGHSLNTATITHLLKNNSCISFFEPDGNPVGIIRPYGNCTDKEILRLQENLPRHRYATIIAQATLKSRLIAIERLQELRGSKILYEGELQVLHNALDEIEYLVKLDEIRRLSNLTTDMYYEILSRDIPDCFNFRRRTVRPQCDPINAMLSFGYAMLYGNCCVSVIGARLDPDIGVLHEGQGALVRDLIGPFKAVMIDPLVCSIARESLKPEDFELTQTRCMLSDALVKKLISTFKKSIDNEKIDHQVNKFLKAIQKSEDFTVTY
ncbi:MAG TPA: CRISPR-associated endonuclease Cas1 [Methanoregula sp.]|nr:CRISPR-associated endonuclease Cas1 [Methanoregula sp.]